jgi:hypothetical protein
MRPASAGKRVALTRAEAHACWPAASVSADGNMASPGEYVIPHAGGWIHAGFAVTRISAGSHVLSPRDALAYSCHLSYTVTVQSWEQWATNITFTTGNTVRYCDWAYNNWKTPACSGFGRCAPAATGVIGNYTATVNPWYNQVVDYLAMTEFFYCRHYIRADMTTSAYCD